MQTDIKAESKVKKEEKKETMGESEADSDAIPVSSASGAEVDIRIKEEVRSGVA